MLHKSKTYKNKIAYSICKPERYDELDDNMEFDEEILADFTPNDFFNLNDFFDKLTPDDTIEGCLNDDNYYDLTHYKINSRFRALFNYNNNIAVVKLHKYANSWGDYVFYIAGPKNKIDAIWKIKNI